MSDEEKMLTYGEYLRVPELLKLQHCLSKPEHPDELQFIIIHQAYELWFKQVLHELDRVAGFLEKGDSLAVHEALHKMNRVLAIQELLLQQIRILETMRPADFMEFRKNLNPASGFQSTQFRELEFFAGARNPKLLELCFGDEEMVQRAKRRYESKSLWDHLCTCLRKNGFQVEPGAGGNVKELARLCRSHLEHPELYELVEAFLEFDENLQLWRFHHVRMVERMIGEMPGTGSSVNEGLDGAQYLRSTVNKRCFPDLWEARSHLEG